MCCSGSTMALWYFGYSRKNTFSWQNTWKYFWGYFSFVLLGRKLENLFCFSFSGTRNIIFGTLKIGQNDPKIPNLEFENHGFLENQVFLPTEQVGTNICWMIYQDTNFKICLSLFGWKEKILPYLHIVHCCLALGVGDLGRMEFSAVSRVKVCWIASPFHYL